MRAFLDGGLGKADKDLLGQSAGGDIDLDLNGQGLEADESEGLEFGKHSFVALSLGDGFFRSPLSLRHGAGVKDISWAVQQTPYCARKNRVLQGLGPLAMRGWEEYD